MVFGGIQICIKLIISCVCTYVRSSQCHCVLRQSKGLRYSILQRIVTVTVTTHKNKRWTDAVSNKNKESDSPIKIHVYLSCLSMFAAVGFRFGRWLINLSLATDNRVVLQTM